MSESELTMRLPSWRYEKRVKDAHSAFRLFYEKKRNRLVWLVIAFLSGGDEGRIVELANFFILIQYAQEVQVAFSLVGFKPTG